MASSRFVPMAFVDGYQMPSAGWGRIVAPTAPGRHHVHVYSHDGLYRTKFGRAEAVIDVQPSQWVELEYRMPSLGGPGSLGPLTAGGTSGFNIFYVVIGAMFLVPLVVALILLVIAAIGAK